MLHRILVYWGFHFIGWLACWRAYGTWLASTRARRGRVAVGVGLVFACLGTQFLPFLWSDQLQTLKEDRQTQHLFGLALTVAMGTWILLGLVRFGTKVKSQKALGACPTEKDNLAPEEVLERFQHARARLRHWQDGITKDSGSRVPLVLSESVHRPILFGLNPPRIFVPFEWVDAGVDLREHLAALAARAERKTYWVCMVLWWWAQLDLALLPMGDLLWRALELQWGLEVANPGPGTHGCNVQDPVVVEESRVEAGARLCSRSSIHLRKKAVGIHQLPVLLASVTIQVLGCLWGIHWAGGLNINEFLDFVMNKEIIGFSAHGFDPTVEFTAIPGEGGALPDGLRVDTTKADGKTGCATVRVPLGLFEHEKWIPFGAKAVRVRLSWRVEEKRPNASELPAVKLATSEQGVIDADGQQKLWTYYSRHVFLGENGEMAGTMDLPILVHTETRVLPDSKDVVYGPILYIPEGWRIAFRQYWVEQIEPSNVPSVPEGEGKRFVAWYQRNGFKPATIDLQWRESPGETR